MITIRTNIKCSKHNIKKKVKYEQTTKIEENKLRDVADKLRSNICNVEEMEWFSNADFSMYEGKYIATIGKNVVAFGDNAKLVRDEARRKFPNEEPIITKIPNDDLLVLW